MKVFLTQLRAYSEDFEENFREVNRALDNSGAIFSPDDILLLPELLGGEAPHAEYEAFVSSLGSKLRCFVVGGSHYKAAPGRKTNCGAVADPTGIIVSRYQKLWPYGIEVKMGVAPGGKTGHFEVAGCRVMVLVCSDFWYSSVILSRLHPRPDLVLVPTFSISLRPSPLAARSLWKSMAISRAYEFGVYVGISDWAHPCDYHGLKSSSVAGFADPRPQSHDGFFSPLGIQPVVGYELELARLRWLREHRSSRAFLSDENLTRSRSGARRKIPLGKTPSQI
jgi:hypothetical protein